jgi:hypothetical protein
VIEQFFLDGLPVEPGDGAQPPRDGGPGAGRERTEAEYASLLSAADLKLDRVIPTTAGASILEATAA